MPIQEKNDIFDTFFCGLDQNDLSLLSREEEINLAREIEKGKKAEKMLDCKTSLDEKKKKKLFSVVDRGRKALNRLMMSCLKWMIKIAKNHIGRHYGFTFSDLIQEGTIGLMIAAKKFDWTMGCRFATYASYWIKQCIQKASETKSRIVKIPTYVLRKIPIYNTIRTVFFDKFNREPLDKEIASMMGIGIKKVQYIKKAAVQTLYIDEDFVLSDQLLYCNDEEFLKEEKERLQKALNALPDREREVIMDRFGLNGREELTLIDIGRKFGLSKERIRQIEESALATLRRDEKLLKLAC